MMKDILESVKSVMVELGSGMAESCKVVYGESCNFYADVDAKLMGSYEEIETFEKSKEATVAVETEK